MSGRCRHGRFGRKGARQPAESGAMGSSTRWRQGDQDPGSASVLLIPTPAPNTSRIEGPRSLPARQQVIAAQVAETLPLQQPAA